MALSFLPLAMFLLRTVTEGVQWPEHVVCTLPHLRLSYVSCDPLQDIGFTLDHCPDLFRRKVHSKVSFLLRHSIEEVYLSVDLFVGNAEPVHYDETLCLPHIQRFTFCGQKKGELLNQDWPLDVKLAPPKGHFIAQIRLINQDADQIACANVTFIFG
ncbi:hypothetical protein ACEWY4_019287 [Coilia grayii]|uniref:MD-2-related lipid-recognition domain-containing protein n=1 Tax=Coilia grayii TaxID=363190 RepID=A0ABD1JFP3_9TELE